MLLFEIPDIRLFWSKDSRFLDQFKNVDVSAPLLKTNLRRFVPFSKYPSCKKDMSFWLPPSASPTTSSTSSEQSNNTGSASAAGGDIEKKGGGPLGDIHENDIMEIIREVGGSAVEDVKLFDEFTKKDDAVPGGTRTSLAYNFVYRDLERTLTNAEANEVHNRIKKALVKRLGVVLR